MRNLLQFPITDEEVRAAIQTQLDRLNGDGDITKMIVGGTQQAIFSAILRVLNTQLDKDLTVMDLVLEDVNP